MSIAIIKEAVVLCRRSGISSFVWGHRGLGKSSLHKQVCLDNNWGFIDMRCSQMEASDLRGLPDKLDNQTVYLPPAELPKGHGDSENCPACVNIDKSSPDFIKLKKSTPQNKYCAGMLFLDELNRAEDDVLQAAFQLVLDRTIGLYSMPENWSVHVAGNFAGGTGYSVNNFDDAAFIDRFCHLTLTNDSKYLSDWSNYMVERIPSNTVSKILQFCAFNEEHLVGKVSGNNEISIQPSPRSWEMVARVETIYAQGDISNEAKKAVITGLIGPSLVESYEQFTCKVTTDMILHDGIEKHKDLLDQLSRNELIGLVWALSANSKKKDLTREMMENVMDFMAFLVSHKEKDLTISLATALITSDGADSKLSGVFLSNTELAKLVKKYGFNEDDDRTRVRWLDLLIEREDLQEMVRIITAADDDALAALENKPSENSDDS